MREQNLTLKQADMVILLRNFQHIHGFMPTIRELAAETHRARGTIVQHIQALEKKGVLRTHRGKARAIEILQAA